MWSTRVFHEIKLFSAVIHKISPKKESINAVYGARASLY